MALTAGTRLGHYDVTSLIGEGGMGQVWQATDTQLNRQVALKILPDAFADDPDRLARFQREAQVLASLNHTNIGTIYGLEEAEGVKALVLELVEGPTLADRIKQGPLPIDQALPIAKQIAEALEAAHEQGVIHRDLKPANIKVREDGTVKVLDFGLAKAFQLDASDPNMSASPTISLTAAATQMGMVIGTAAYMAPEQASGKSVDKRADVWAFGAVLYEMLTGTRPFVGDDLSKTLARVIAIDPDWGALPENVPPVLGTFLRGCLEKDPRHRVRDIGDVRLALSGSFETAVFPEAPPNLGPPPSVWSRVAQISVVALAAAMVAGTAVWTMTDRSSPAVTRFQLPLRANESFAYTGRQVVAISPDGRRIVYAATNGLVSRTLDQLQTTSIAGTEGARSPFFSPDGQWIGFWDEGRLEKISVSGGASVALGRATNPYGATWGSDDMILFGQGPAGIWQVPAAGGTPELVVAVEEGQIAYGPQMLDGGDWVLFTLSGGSWEDAQIVIESVSTHERRVLISGGRDARYLATGHLIYALDDNVLAVAFDADRLSVTPGPVPVLRDVASSTPTTGATQFSVASNGSIVYVQNGALARLQALVWVDRDGQSTGSSAEEDAYQHPRLASNGNQVTVDTDDGVWVVDLDRGTKLHLAPRGNHPIWTPDDRLVTFGSEGGLYSRPADASEETELLWASDHTLEPMSWAPDGERLAFVDSLGDGGGDIWILPRGADAEAFLATPAYEEGPVFSPDGRWLAYVSDESGRREVYVTEYPGPGGTWPISGACAVHCWWDGAKTLRRGELQPRSCI